MLIVCFDIFCNKRRRQVNRLLLGYGERVQQSVFECYLSEAKIKQLQHQMIEIIADEDKVSYYCLCNKDSEQRWALGSAEVSKNNDYYYL